MNRICRTDLCWRSIQKWAHTIWCGIMTKVVLELTPAVEPALCSVSLGDTETNHTRHQTSGIIIRVSDHKTHSESGFVVLLVVSYQIQNLLSMTCKITPLIDLVSFLLHQGANNFVSSSQYFWSFLAHYAFAIYNFFPDVQVFYSLKA